MRLINFVGPLIGPIVTLVLVSSLLAIVSLAQSVDKQTNAGKLQARILLETNNLDIDEKSTQAANQKNSSAQLDGRAKNVNIRRLKKGPRAENRLSNLWSMFLPDTATVDNDYEDSSPIAEEPPARSSPINATSSSVAKTNDELAKPADASPKPNETSNAVRQYPQLITGALTSDLAATNIGSGDSGDSQPSNSSMLAAESIQHPAKPESFVSESSVNSKIHRQQPALRHRISTSESKRLTPIGRFNSNAMSSVQHPFQRQNQSQLIQGIKYPMAQASTISISTHDAVPSGSDLVPTRALDHESPTRNSSSSNDDQVVQTEYQSQDEILRQVTSAINFERELSSLTKQPSDGSNHRANDELESSLMPDGANRMFKVGSSLDELMSRPSSSNNNTSSTELTSASLSSSSLDILKSSLNNNSAIASQQTRASDDNQLDKTNFEQLANKLRQLAMQSQKAASQQQATNQPDQPSWLRRPIDGLNKESFMRQHGASLSQLTSGLVSNQSSQLTSGPELSKQQNESTSNQTIAKLEKIRDLLSKHANRTKSHQLAKDSSATVDLLLQQLTQLTSSGELGKDQKVGETKNEQPASGAGADSNLGWRPMSQSMVALSPANLVKANKIKLPVAGYQHLGQSAEETVDEIDEYSINELADLLANSRPTDEEAHILAEHKGAHLLKPMYPAKHQPRTRAQSSVHHVQLTRPQTNRKIAQRQYQMVVPYGQVRASSQQLHYAPRVKSHLAQAASGSQRQPHSLYQPGAFPPFHRPHGQHTGQQLAVGHQLDKYQATLLHDPSGYAIQDSELVNTSPYSGQHGYSYIHSGSVSSPTQTSMESAQVVSEPPKMVAVTEEMAVEKQANLQPATPASSLEPKQPNIATSTESVLAAGHHSASPNELGADELPARLVSKQPQAQHQERPIPMIINHHQQQQQQQHGHSAPFYGSQGKTHNGLGQEMSQLVGAQQLAPNTVSSNGMPPPIRYREVSIYRPFGYQSHHAIAYQASPTMAALFPGLSQPPRPGFLRHMSPLRSRLQDGQRILGPLLSAPPIGQQLTGNLRHQHQVGPIQGQFQSQATYSAAPLPITAVRQHYIRIGNQMKRRQSPAQEPDWPTSRGKHEARHQLEQEFYQQLPVEGNQVDEGDNLDDQNFEEVRYMPMEKLIQSSKDHNNHRRVVNQIAHAKTGPHSRRVMINGHRAAGDTTTKSGRRQVDMERRQQRAFWSDTKTRSITTRSPVACSTTEAASNSTIASTTTITAATTTTTEPTIRTLGQTQMPVAVNQTEPITTVASVLGTTPNPMVVGNVTSV